MNLVVLSGNLGGDARADPKPGRYGGEIIRFRLAVTSWEYTGEGRPRKERTDWFACVRIGSPKLKPHLVKGRAVLVRGRIRINPHENDDRSYGSAITVYVDDLELTGPPPEKPPAPAPQDIEDNKVPL